MGVIGLWSILDAGARPVRLEALAKKRLAVDASIWIYQFLKAVRDKEGNVLKNAHVVGFFRRICKLLFHGIQPVFVFDGVAPLLKRQTLRNRKVLREGGRIDVAKTAGKILAVQMRKRALEEAERQKCEQDGRRNIEEPEPENAVYFDELQLPSAEIQKKKFKKSDQYHLPEMSTDLERAGGAHDPRIMTHEELLAYARDYEGGEDMNLYDFSNINYDSDMFKSLPAADQYSILNAARLRSRLRMGLSTEQLTDMFPDRMAFSRFQIERVKERSDLTNRLMNLNGMNDVGAVQRIASERGKEYILVKNEAADGGWSLGVVNSAEKPIIIDREVRDKLGTADDDEDDGEFEDVPIGAQDTEDGHPDSREPTAEEMIKFALEESRRAQMASTKPAPDFRPTSRRQGSTSTTSARRSTALPLFARDDSIQDSVDIIDNFEHRRNPDTETTSIHQEPTWEEEEASELRKAMAMSLASEPAAEPHTAGGFVLEDDDEVSPPAALHSPSKAEGSATAISSRFELPFPTLDFSSSMLASTTIPAHNSKLAPQAKAEEARANVSTRPLDKLQRALDLSLDADRIDLEGASDSEVFEDDSNNRSPKHAASTGIDAPRSVPTWFQEEVTKPEAPPAHSGHDLEPSMDKYHIVETSDVVDLTHEDALSSESKRTPGDGIPRQRSNLIDLDAQEIQEPEIIREIDVEKGHPQDPIRDSNLEVERTDSPEWLEAEDSPDAPQREDPGNASDVEINHSTESNIPDRDIPELAVEDSLLDEVDQTRLGEEEDMLARMAAEENEYARFSASLGNKTVDNYTNLDYEQDLRALKNEQRKNLRDADEVTQIMVQECQELLAQFGIPYLTATSEAESQCAKLVQLNLVDGIVTDDSDVFLFGGTRVYRNMFNTAKTVECYVLSDLEREFDLDREKLIQLAYLLGSDYTEGIKKIGPVLALELIAEFQGDSGLEDFKQYVDRVQSDREVAEDTDSAFRKKFKKTAEKLVLPDNFPNPLVKQAYTHPEVDTDATLFEWGQPDVDALRSYLMRQCGWHQEYTDSQLLPVIKDMNVRVNVKKWQEAKADLCR